MAKKRRFVRVDAVLNNIEARKQATPALSQELSMELATAGKEEVQRIIDTSGVGRPWKVRPLPAKWDPRRGSDRNISSPGRVNTGQMRDAVRVRFEGGGSRKIAAFGWINAPAEDQQYFLAQDRGFTKGGFRKPVEVRGMFALRDARKYVADELLPKLSQKYVRRIARGR